MERNGTNAHAINGNPIAIWIDRRHDRFGDDSNAN